VTNQRESIQTAQSDLGMTAGQLAEALGISVNTLKAWKYGRNPMPKTALMALEHLSCAKNMAKLYPLLDNLFEKRVSRESLIAERFVNEIRGSSK